MGNWKQDSLDGICNIVKGEQLNKLDLERSGEYPCINGGIEPSGYTNKWNRLENTITISEGGNSCGFINYLKVKFWSGGHCYTLQDIKDGFDTDYLYYALKGKEYKIMGLRVGSGLPNIQQKAIKSFEIQYPEDKPEQTRIAEILSTADEAIAHTEALIAKYQRIKTGLIQDLLTKGIDENGNIRSKATHKFVVKNGIEVPEEWEVDTLGTLIKAIDAHPSHRTPTSIENGAPYLGISDIDDEGNIDLKKCRKVSYSVLAEHNNRYQLRDGDIIFGKIGTIGEPKRLKAWNNVTISANVILIQPHNTSDFIFWVLNSEYINNQVKNTIHSTSQPAFGMEKVRALTILIPPKNERETIQNILNQNESNILSTKRHLSKLQSLKTGLMQDLLSGKVRVNMDNKN